MISKLLKGLGDKKDSKSKDQAAAAPVPVTVSTQPQQQDKAAPKPVSVDRAVPSPLTSAHCSPPSGKSKSSSGEGGSSSSPNMGGRSSSSASSSKEPERFQSRGSGRVERGSSVFPTTSFNSNNSSDGDNAHQQQRSNSSGGRYKSPPMGGGGSYAARSLSPSRDSPVPISTTPKSSEATPVAAGDGGGSSPSITVSGFRQARRISTGGSAGAGAGAVGFSQDRKTRPTSPQTLTTSGCPFGGDEDSNTGLNNSHSRSPMASSPTATFAVPVAGASEVSYRAFLDNIGSLSARFYTIHPEERLDDMENSDDVVKLRKLHHPLSPLLNQTTKGKKLPGRDHNGNKAIAAVFGSTSRQVSGAAGEVGEEDGPSTTTTSPTKKGFLSINNNSWKRPFDDDDNMITSTSPLPRHLVIPPLVPDANMEALLGPNWATAHLQSSTTTSPTYDHNTPSSSPNGNAADGGGDGEEDEEEASRPFGNMQDTINDFTARMGHENINPEDITGGVAELYHTAFLRQPLSAYCTKKFKKLAQVNRMPSGGLSPFRGPHRRTQSTSSANRGGFRPSPRGGHDPTGTSTKVVDLPGVAEQFQQTPEAFVFHQHFRHRATNGQSGTTSTGRTPHGSSLAPSGNHPSRGLRGSSRPPRDILLVNTNVSPPCTPRSREAGCGLRQLTTLELAELEVVGDALGGCDRSGQESSSSSTSSSGEDNDMVEGLLATGGDNPAGLSASFSLAPTNYITPADTDEQIPGKPISPSEASPSPSPTNSDDLAPPSPSEHSNNSGPTGGGDNNASSAVPLLTCLDIVTSNGTMLCVMGDAQGRVELLEGPEGPDWEERGPPSQRIISRKRQTSIIAAAAGGGGSANATDFAAAAPSSTGTTRMASLSILDVPLMRRASPVPGYISPALPESGSMDNLSPRSITNTPRNNESMTSSSSAYGIPPLRHDEAAALAGGHSGTGVPMFRTSPNRSAARSSAFKPKEPGLATQCGNFFRRCQHQAFVNEFDCLKSVVIDQQLRCVKFLPPNRAQGVTSYLAANEKTIKLFRIKSEQYQQSSAWEPPCNESGSTLLSCANSGNFSSSTNTAPPSIHNINKKRRHSLRGSVGSPNTNRLHRRIIMPVKAFTNVHQYPIQSISLSADGETFLSMDDFRVYWWHLDAQDTTKATLLCDIKPPGNSEIDTLLTASSFHHTHSSLFLCAQSDGVCNVGDLRDPPCRGKSRQYPVTFKINPELHNAINHPYHDDILSAISAASFLGHNYVVTRDYMTLKLWDMRNSTCPAATCPVMGYLGNTIDFLYDSDYIFDRFPLAVDNASMTVVTGMYDGTVAVWRPGRGLYRNSTLPGADNNEYLDPNATSPFGFGRSSGRSPQSPSYNNTPNHKYIASCGGVVAAYDEVEFYAAQQPLGSTDPLNSKGKDKDIMAVVQQQIREARLKKRKGGQAGNGTFTSSTSNNNHQRSLSRNSFEGSTVGTTGPCTGSFHESDTALEGSEDGSRASSTYSGDLDDLEDELEPYEQAADITDMWDVSDDGLGTAYVPKAHKTHISLSLLKARSVVLSAEEDEELLYKREKNRRTEEARVRRRQEILRSQQAAALGGSSSSDEEARAGDSGVRRTGMDALEDESKGAQDSTTATTHEDDTQTVYPRVRSRCRDRRVTNVAISPGGDRFSFSTNEHVFFFNSAL